MSCDQQCKKCNITPVETEKLNKLIKEINLSTPMPCIHAEEIATLFNLAEAQMLITVDMWNNRLKLAQKKQYDKISGNFTVNLTKVNQANSALRASEEGLELISGLKKDVLDKLATCLNSNS